PEQLLRPARGAHAGGRSGGGGEIPDGQQPHYRHSGWREAPGHHGGGPMKLLVVLLAVGSACAQIRLLPYPAKSPLVTFRIVFTSGAAADPPDKPGLAALTAHLLADGGTRELTYRQVEDAMFPIAGSVAVQVDKEMTAFSGVTHVDNLQAYYKLLRARLVEPG